MQTTWTALSQAAQGRRDDELHQLTVLANQEIRQLAWLNTRMKVAAPQALIAAQ
jgi:hypothetical protein